MAQVVKTGAAESGVAEEGAEVLGDAAGVEWAAGGCGEDQVPSVSTKFSTAAEYQG